MPVRAVAPARIDRLKPDVRTFTDPYVSVSIDRVRFPNGAEGTYARVSPRTSHGAVAVVRRIYRGVAYFGLVRQYRYPIGEATWEFPRGVTNEDTLGGMRQEVAEEVGAHVERALRIGRIHPDTGLLTTAVDVYDVRVPATAPAVHTEDETGLVLHWVTGGELAGLIARGQVTCGMTLAALALLRATGHEELPL